MRNKGPEMKTILAPILLITGCSQRSDYSKADKLIDRVSPVYDLHIIAKGSCQNAIYGAVEKLGARTRTNLPLTWDRVSNQIYGPLSYANAINGKDAAVSLKCANNIIVVRSKRGNLCPAC